MKSRRRLGRVDERDLVRQIEQGRVGDEVLRAALSCLRRQPHRLSRILARMAPAEAVDILPSTGVVSERAVTTDRQLDVRCDYVIRDANGTVIGGVAVRRDPVTRKPVEYFVTKRSEEALRLFFEKNESSCAKFDKTLDEALAIGLGDDPNDGYVGYVARVMAAAPLVISVSGTVKDGLVLRGVGLDQAGVTFNLVQTSNDSVVKSRSATITSGSAKRIALGPMDSVSETEYLEVVDESGDRYRIPVPLVQQ